MSDSLFTSKSLNTAVQQVTGTVSNLIPSSNTTISGKVGTWSYIITALNGGEGVSSSGISYVNASNYGVDVSFTTISGINDYRLYRSGVGYTGYLLASNSASGSPITDSFDLTISGYSRYYNGVNTTSLKSRGLSTIPTMFYTSSGNKTLFKEAILTNNSEYTIGFYVYSVPSGENPSAGNCIFSNVSLEPSESKILSLNTVLENGDSIYAKSTDVGYIPGYCAVSFKISGIEISNT